MIVTRFTNYCYQVEFVASEVEVLRAGMLPDNPLLEDVIAEILEYGLTRLAEDNLENGD